MSHGQHDKDMGIVILNPYRGGTVRTIKANYQKVSLANLISTDALGATGIMEIYDEECDTSGESD